MPRKKIIRTNEFPYHVTARTNNQEWFKLSLDEVWSIFERVLSKVQLRYSIEIYQFVLMSNHYHLLLSTPEANIDKAIQVIALVAIAVN